MTGHLRSVADAPGEKVPVPASPEMIALAAKTRPDWDPRNVQAVLASAHSIGMSWEQVLAGMGRLMADPKAMPGELVPDWRDPVAAAHRHGAGPNDEWRQARERLGGGPGGT